jgi:hypothetical protein
VGGTPGFRLTNPNHSDWAAEDITVDSTGTEFSIPELNSYGVIDLDSQAPGPDGGASWDSGMKVKGRIDEVRKVWYGEMRIPLHSIANKQFQPGERLRLGLFRLAIAATDRSLAAWRLASGVTFMYRKRSGPWFSHGPASTHQI